STRPARPPDSGTAPRGEAERRGNTYTQGVTTVARNGTVSVTHDVPVRMRDGVSLNADMYVPEGPGPFPVLLMRSPYNKTQGQDSVYAHPSWYARRGYMVVIQDVRGRWMS